MDVDVSSWQEHINIYNLKVARRNIGLSSLDASRKVSASKKTNSVEAWEEGLKYPTYIQLEKLAKIYQVGVMQLLIPDKLPTTSPPQTFRSSKTDSDLSYSLLRFIDILRTRQEIISQNLIKDNAPNHPLVGLGIQSRSPQELANLIRKELAYDPNKSTGFSSCLNYLRHLCEARGIFVFKTMSTIRPIISLDEMKGLYLDDPFAPVIAINRRDFPRSQLFTLAHELAHLFRANEKVESVAFRDLGTIRDKEEVFCNQTAARLLIPDDGLARYKNTNLDGIKDLAKKYHVSNLVALYRLSELGYLGSRQTKIFTEKMNRDYEDSLKKIIKSKAEGGHYYNAMRDSNGRLFNEFVFSLYIDNRISVVEAQNLIKMPLQEIEYES